MTVSPALIFQSRKPFENEGSSSGAVAPASEVKTHGIMANHSRRPPDQLTVCYSACVS